MENMKELSLNEMEMISGGSGGSCTPLPQNPDFRSSRSGKVIN